MKRTDRMISTLTIYLITNNLLTSFITTAGVITFFASPRTLVYEAFNVVISKAYTNTFLSQLNVRESIRGRGAIVTKSDAVIKTAKLDESNFGPSRYRTPTGELSTFEAVDPRAINISVSRSEITSFQRSSTYDDDVHSHSAGGITDNEKPLV